jgi:hypothetical protein
MLDPVERSARAGCAAGAINLLSPPIRDQVRQIKPGLLTLDENVTARGMS